MKKLKMGMVGGGSEAFIGAVHRAAALMDGQIEFVAGALSSTSEKAIASGQELGLSNERNYGSWEGMLERELSLSEEERVDFVSVVTPNHMHFPVTQAFAEAGMNIVCDKPMVHTSEQAKELVETVEENSIIFAVTYQYTGYPMVKQARHMVRRGDLGDIRKVIVEYSQDWLAAKAEENGAKQAEWRTDPERAGIAGAMGDIGSHAENLVSTVTGLEISEICADLTAFVAGRQLDDDGNLLIRYKGGAKGVMIASQVSAGEENLKKIEPVVDILREIGEAHDKQPAQVALNWLITQRNVVPIPGAKNERQARQNAGTLGWEMTGEEAEKLELATLGWR